MRTLKQAQEYANKMNATFISKGSKVRMKVVPLELYTTVLVAESESEAFDELTEDQQRKMLQLSKEARAKKELPKVEDATKLSEVKETEK